MSIANSLSPTPPQPPPSFSKLGPRISLYVPPNHASGYLIILCTWLGARLKHIDKYIQTYHTIAPTARILLIESDVRAITSSYGAQRKAIIPAVEVLRAVLDERSEPKILLHTFSNGGPNSATQMLVVLREQTGAPLPLVGTICDSGPAAGEYWKNYNAMVLSLPPGIARTIGIPVIHVILILLAASVAMGRYDKLEDLIRGTLVGEEYVDGSGKEGVKRISYVYSKADVMVDWRDVAAHADIARQKGWEVDEWCLVDTAHCNHFKGNVEGYVQRMRGMWEGKGFVEEVS